MPGGKSRPFNDVVLSMRDADGRALSGAFVLRNRPAAVTRGDPVLLGFLSGL